MWDGRPCLSENDGESVGEPAESCRLVDSCLRGPLSAYPSLPVAAMRAAWETVALSADAVRYDGIPFPPSLQGPLFDHLIPPA